MNMTSFSAPSELSWGDSSAPVVRLPEVPPPRVLPLPSESVSTSVEQWVTATAGRTFSAADDVSEPALAGPAASLREAMPRFRKRGRFTNVVARQLARHPTWWSDLGGEQGPGLVSAWLRSQFEGTGIKLARGGVSVGGGGPGGGSSEPPADGESSAPRDASSLEPAPEPVHLVRVAFERNGSTRWLWVSPELVAALSVVRLFRPVTEGLLASLRSRARLWAEERRVSVMDLVRFLPGTLVLAALPTPDEVTAHAALRGDAGRWSASALGSFAKGVLRDGDGPSFWDCLRPALRFGGPVRGTLVDGVRSLSLPS